MKTLIAGNWKMNLDMEAAATLAQQIAEGADSVTGADLAVCPVGLHVGLVVDLLKSTDVAVGGQDCCDQASGAYTGQVSAGQLRDVGCAYVIVGHSERRQYNGETDSLVKAKAEQAIEAGVVPIICVGETLEQREAGQEQFIVGQQLAGSVPDDAINYVVAYEPVWAIGTGKVASVADVTAMHAFIRTKVGVGVRILYGGSMKPDNAVELLATPNVDGGLVGGASLDAESFLSLAKCV